MAIIERARYPSPIGTIAIVVRDGRLCALGFGEKEQAQRDSLERRFGSLRVREARDPAGIVSALRAYFNGRLRALDRIEVDPGGTPFQSRVWHELRTVPAGRTVSYGDLAEAIGEPHAARAVGGANHRNPIALVIPCHRVIGRDHRLVGYAGGLDRKRWLLDHEGALPS